VIDDVLPPEVLVDGIPCWAFDMHVREGNQAMSRFLKTDCETARWIEVNVPIAKRRKFLGNILFCVESGLVTNRLRWTVGDDLRHMADYQCHSVEPSSVQEIMVLLHHDLPLLNKERGHVTTSNLL
jgi:hypothetical protein